MLILGIPAYTLMRNARAWLERLGLAAGLFLASGVASGEADAVTVRYHEGVTHGFLTLRSTTGDLLAEGDLLQVVRAEGVDSRLVFRFRDGSLYDETVVFSQSRVFTLLSYRLQQRGLGLLRGVAAALFGKTPADYHCWIVTADLPAFVANDGPLYAGGPIWRFETVSPRGPARPAAGR